MGSIPWYSGDIYEQVALSSRTAEKGEAEVACPIQYEGDPLELRFTPAFLVDALRVIEADNVSLEMNANNKPAVLKAGADFLYALMPLDPG